MPHSSGSWIARLLRRDRAEQDLAREIEFHIEEHARDLEAGGCTRQEAFRLARLALGGPEQVKEECRDARGTRWLEDLWRDARYAVRTLRKHPEFTLAAALSIAVGVGVTTVVFAAVKAVVLDPLPYARPEELVQLATDHGGAPRSNGDWVFEEDARAIAARVGSFQSTGLYSNAILDLAGTAANLPEALYGLKVSASLFPVLGVAPALGRNILPEEDQPGQPDVLVLSDGLWRARFQADPTIIGRTIRANGRDCRVIGVMTRGFDFPLRRAAARTPTPYVQFWMPMRLNPAAPSPGAMSQVARLRPGVTLAQAQAELTSVSAALAHERPSTNRDRTHRVAYLRDRTLRGSANALGVLLAASVMFLLIGCGNVANLLLARGFARQREIAIRLAIGAGRGRIFRQLLTESVVLAAAGGVGGVALAALAWRLLPALVPLAIPRLAGAHLDGAVLAFALAAATMAGLGAGVLPAWRAVRGVPAAGIRDRLRTVLVVSEVALTAMLAIVGGSFGGRFLDLLRVDPGFDAAHTYAAIVLPATERYPTPESRERLYQRFLDAVRALPGVSAAGVVDALPFSGENHGGFVSAHERAPFEPANQVLAEVDVVGGDYLQALDVRLLQGRWFRPEEMDPNATSILVDDTLAHRLWPGASAVGRRLCVSCTPEHPDRWLRVVGVVSSVRHSSLEGTVHQNVYLAAGALREAAFLVLRVDDPHASWGRAVRAAIASIDPAQPVLLSASLRSFVDDSLADRRFVLLLLGATAVLALLLSAAGVYGVMAFLAARRQREIAVRMALGATPRQVGALLFRQGVTQVASGLAAGWAVSALLLRFLRTAVTGFEPTMGLLLPALAAFVLAATLLACWVPARRARRLDPASALRCD